MSAHGLLEYSKENFGSLMMCRGAGNINLPNGLWTFPTSIEIISSWNNGDYFSVSFTYKKEHEMTIFNWFQAQCLMADWK